MRLEVRHEVFIGIVRDWELHYPQMEGVIRIRPRRDEIIVSLFRDAMIVLKLEILPFHAAAHMNGDPDIL